MSKSTPGKILIVFASVLLSGTGAFGQLIRQPNTTLNLSQSTPPATLSATGAFADLTTLTPNTGIVAYTPNVPFWSDYAKKTRWFSIPDITRTMTFSRDSNWTFPTGTIWIKHFDLPNERTDPNGPSRRIETRFLVKTDTAAYGLTYKWRDDQTDADLVVSSGEQVAYMVYVNGAPTFQNWTYPSRSACTQCHTSVGGRALSFTTRQMNASHVYGSQNLNQVQALSDAGYFFAPVTGVNNLPAFAKANDTTQNLEWRTRSYFAVNCSQCHQPSGPTPGYWDARPTTPLDQAQIINGVLYNNIGDPNYRFIVPGDLNHSMSFLRIAGIAQRMPPIGTNELDPDNMQLLSDWVTQALPQRLSFTQWQLYYFGSTKDPIAAPDEWSTKCCLWGNNVDLVPRHRARSTKCSQPLPQFAPRFHIREQPGKRSFTGRRGHERVRRNQGEQKRSG